MKTFYLLLIGVGLSFTLSAQQLAPFKAGDKIAFVGNSITDGGHYHSYIWLYYMTRFPQERLTIYNVGIGGDRSFEINRRFDEDVLPKNPNVLYLTFGMNDTGYFEYNQPGAEEFAKSKIEESYQNYLPVEKKLQNLSGARIALIGSSPYDETAVIENNAFANKNKAMQKIVEFQRASADKNGWEFLDLNAPMTAINEKNQLLDPAFTLCGDDRIHPDNNGHMVMAYLFLQAQGWAGKKVAEVDIDLKKKEIETENCNVSGYVLSSSFVSFNYLAKALPYPLDTVARGWGARYSQADAARLVPFVEEMNQEVVKVKALDKGNYRLCIDNLFIGNFSSSELAEGVNLALYPQTPQYQQALAVMHLNEERWEIERRFRQYAWIQFNFFYDKGLLFADNQEAIDALNEKIPEDGWVRGHRDIYTRAMHPEIREVWTKEMDLLVDKIYELNQPRVREVRLEKIQ